MAGVNVKSEIKPLKKVLLHRPGDELLNLTPNTLEELLFDDIPFLQVAQAEHDAFADILRSEGVEVVYLEDLMADVVAQPGRREQFLAQWLSEANIHTDLYRGIISDYLAENYADPKAFVMKTMAGINLQRASQRQDRHPGRSGLRCFQARGSSHAEPVLHPRPLRDDRQRCLPEQDVLRHP